jgi:tagatose-1,6-bisphosphate aldolase
LDCSVLVDKVHELYEQKNDYIEKMNESGRTDAIPMILNLINEAAGE